MYKYFVGLALGTLIFRDLFTLLQISNTVFQQYLVILVIHQNSKLANSKRHN